MSQGMIARGISLALLLFAGCEGGGGGGAADAGSTDAAVVDVSTTDGGAVTADEVVRACSFLHLCQYTTFPEHLAGNAPSCVQKVANAAIGIDTPTAEARQVFARLRACGASSTTCDAFRRCMNLGTIRTCAGPRDHRCEGNTAIRCRHSTDAYPTTIACDQLGLACQGGQCVGPMTAPACNADAPPRCDGSAVVTCLGGREAREDCAALGGTCLAGSPARCVPAGTMPCATPGAMCTGHALTGCRPAPDTGMAYTVRYDCAAGMRTCGMAAPAGFACLPATECSDPPRQWGGTCDGNAVVACIEGRRVRMPCSAVGRTTCNASPSIATCAD